MKTVLIRSVRLRLKISKFVTVLILWLPGDHIMSIIIITMIIITIIASWKINEVGSVFVYITFSTRFVGFIFIHKGTVF